MESSTQKHEAQARLSAQPPNAHATSPRPSHDTTRNIPPTDRSDDKTGVYDHSSELESQSTAEPVDAKHDTREITDEIEDAVVGDTEERLSEKLCRVRCTTWWLAGALLIAVPLIVFATIFTKVNISGIRIIGLAIWFEIVWTAGWIIHFSLHILDKGWTKFCATGLQTWAELINRTSSSQLGLVLSAIAWGSSCIICRYGDGNCEAKWLTTFRKVLLATIPAAAIFLLKDILLQIVINLQVSRMFNARKVLLYRQREALGLFSEIVINEQKRRPPPHWLHRLRDHWNNRDKGFFIRKRSPITDPFWLKWRRYTDVSGRDDEFDTDEQTFVNLMRDEFRGSIDISLRVENGNIEGGLNEKFLEQKLEELYSNKANKFAKDRPLQAKEIMRILDKDGNDEITPEEWVEALVETTMAYRDISKSAGGIRCAAKSVDAVISCLLLCIVAILYAAFFTNRLSSYLTPIWTTVTGLSFALSGTVTEFITACSFVFSKHPYDIGDRVTIEDKDLIVHKICLQYTIFRRVSDGAVEQIAHKKICDSWIANMSRSKDLSVKETAAIPDNSISICKATLDRYQVTLKQFIKEKAVRFRYLSADDIQISVQSSKDDGRKLVAIIKLKELLVRREDILNGVRIEIRSKLEDIVKAAAESD